MKNNKIIVIVSIIVVLIGFGVIWKMSQKVQSPFSGITNKERNLNPDQIKFYKDRIAKAQEYAKGLDTKDVNYNQNMLNNSIYIAQQSFGLGELEKSKEMYEQAITFNASEVQSYVGLAMVYEDAGDFNNQILTLQKAVELAPKNTDVWLRYLNIRKQRGTGLDEMNKLFITALEKTERHVDIIVSDAIYQGENGNIAGAIKLWQEAMVKYPSNSSLYQSEINKLKKK